MPKELIVTVGSVAELLGICAIIIIVAVCCKAGGFGTFPSFNYHPLFMTLGFVFMFGQGILSFQVISYLNFRVSRMTEKLIHSGTMAMSCMLMLIGWTCADSTDTGGLFTHIDYGGSPHSSIGLATIIVFGLQGAVGFGFFLFPRCGSASMRSKVVKIHRLIGLFSFLMAIVTVMMGATELAVLQTLQALSTLTPSVKSLLALYVACVLFFALSVLTILLHSLLIDEPKGYSKAVMVEVDMSEMVQDASRNSEMVQDASRNSPTDSQTVNC